MVEFKLYDAICEIEVDDCQIYKAYSGRMMYGEKCLGVTYHRDRLAEVVAYLSTKQLYYYDFPMQEIIRLFRESCTDNLGRDNDILYFPQINWQSIEGYDPHCNDNDEDEVQ